jgi:hypothetical protein
MMVSNKGGMQEPGERDGGKSSFGEHAVVEGGRMAPNGPGLANTVKGLGPGVRHVTARTEDIQAMVRAYEDRIARQVKSINGLLEQKEAAEARANEAARLSADARDQVADLARHIDGLKGQIEVLEDDRTDRTVKDHRLVEWLADTVDEQFRDWLGDTFELVRTVIEGMVKDRHKAKLVQEDLFGWLQTAMAGMGLHLGPEMSTPEAVQAAVSWLLAELERAKLVQGILAENVAQVAEAATVVAPVLVEYTASGHSPEDRARAEAPVETLPIGEERPGAGF